MKSKKVYILLLLIIGLFFLFRYNETQSILSVLNQRNDAIRSAGLRVLRNGNVVKSHFNRQRYLKELYNIDTSHCPKKFQLAWLDYVQEVERDIKMEDKALADIAVGAITYQISFLGDAVLTANKATDEKELAKQNLERVALEYNVRILL